MYTGLYLNVFTLLNRVGGKANPPDLLFFFGNDVHSHQDIKGIINSSPNVFMVYGL